MRSILMLPRCWHGPDTHKPVPSPVSAWGVTCFGVLGGRNLLPDPVSFELHEFLAPHRPRSPKTMSSRRSHTGKRAGSPENELDHRKTNLERGGGGGGGGGSVHHSHLLPHSHSSSDRNQVIQLRTERTFFS